MKTKFFLILTVCLIATSVLAQKGINNYKYVIVPNKYDFLKEKDQYQLNSLSQFLFNKHGFVAVMEGGDYPEDLALNRCLAMRADVIKGSGMFSTKLNVILKDCNDKQIFESALGESREKEYKVAYNIALRKAFKSFETVNYSYKPSDDILASSATAAVVKNESQEIEKLKQQIQELESAKAVEQVNSSATSTAVTTAVVPVAVATTVVGKGTAQLEDDTVEEGVGKVLEGVLYAQEIKNGYQLVDSTPKVVYKVKKTHVNNVFLVEGKSAIVFKKGDDWVVEYYENNVLKQHTLNIKF